eukprot:CAMPEP_0119387462 /NCGR_PEP_ID=MMETSP1334-20130426/100788_1 /TAXON_ID=127549 /ORGANISM="Calcidiscus leptoporus, Strain RCC1130" /LENGTH=81 /DNA_ID=CAMNT_0007409209 /DNA_START=12 /DNA_END=253 /DNA_ORIENTATION=+
MIVALLTQILALSPGFVPGEAACRRAILAKAAGILPAAALLPPLPAQATAYAEATMDLLEEVGTLSLGARKLQFEVREATA